MERLVPRRREFLAAAIATLSSIAVPAWALEAPTGKVLLTISGSLEQRNGADVATFDLAMLERLPQHSFVTKTPWYPQPRKFSGVLLRDLLASVGARGSMLTALALNDYRAEIPFDEVLQEEVLLAHRLDDEPMAVRDKGPLVIVYPFDSKKSLRTAVRYSRAVWQLRQLDVK